jgi:hypothetical protein
VKEVDKYLYGDDNDDVIAAYPSQLLKGGKKRKRRKQSNLTGFDAAAGRGTPHEAGTVPRRSTSTISHA